MNINHGDKDEDDEAIENLLAPDSVAFTADEAATFDAAAYDAEACEDFSASLAANSAGISGGHSMRYPATKISVEIEL